MLLATGLLAQSSEIRDPAGDAVTDPRVPRAPDLVSARWERTNGAVTFKVRLAPGTFDPFTVGLVIDVDMHASLAMFDPEAMYMVLLFPHTRDRGADVAKVGGPGAGYVVLGSASVREVENGVDVTVPLTLLGGDTRQVSISVRAYHEAAWPILFDTLPDTGLLHSPPGGLRLPTVNGRDLPRFPEPEWLNGAFRATDPDVTPAVVIKTARPIFPAGVRSVPAEVLIEARVDADGRVRNARLRRSVPEFDQSALDAARKFEFKPATKEGRPVPSIVIIVLDFDVP